MTAAAVKQATDRLISTATQASLYIEDSPHVLMYGPTASIDQFRPGLLKQESEAVRAQSEMERAQRLLAKIQLE